MLTFAQRRAWQGYGAAEHLDHPARMLQRRAVARFRALQPAATGPPVNPLHSVMHQILMAESKATEAEKFVASHPNIENFQELEEAGAAPHQGGLDIVWKFPDGSLVEVRKPHFHDDAAGTVWKMSVMAL